VIAAALLLAACQSSPPEPQPGVSILTGLPLFWGEGGPRTILQAGDQRAAIIHRLSATRKVTPLDRIDAATLSRSPILILAQPRAFQAAELVALDAWVRAGGRVAIFADPALAWPSSLALGDPRRAPLVDLLDPLYTHWGLTLDLTAVQGVPIRQERLGDYGVALVSPGQWVRSDHGRDQHCELAADRLLASCQIGKGRVLLVADADLLDERLWAESGVANDRAILALISRLDSR
jgi:hypothetical protein